MKKLLLLLLFPSLSWGAIGFDAASQQNSTVNFELNATPWQVSWNHTCTGSNLILTVQTNATSGVVGPLVETITYNNVALRRSVQVTDGLIGGINSEFWYLTGPATGTHSIVITFISTGTVIFGMTGAISLTGVNQITPVDVSTSGVLASASSFSLSKATTVDNDWGVDSFFLANTATVTSNNGTIRWSLDVSSNSFHFDASTRGPLTPAGSFSMGYASSASQEAALIVMFLEPFTGAAASGGSSQMNRWMKLDE